MCVLCVCLGPVGLGGGGVLDENKCEMKAFLEATKELCTGKRPGSPQWG